MSIRSKPTNTSERAEDWCDFTPRLPAPPSANPSPPCACWDDLDFGVCLLLGLTAFVAGCVGLAIGVVVMWVVQ